MSEIPLNKFEKEKKVIELHTKEGKTLKEISKIVRMSFRDISRIIKAYDKKIRFEPKKENNQSNKIKRCSKNSRAYDLFSNGKTPVQVAIDLQLDYEKVRKYWTEFLRLNNMKKLYNIYIENEFHLDFLFKIYYFMKRNKISIRDSENVLRAANNLINLNQTYSNLKTEINSLEQKRMRLLYYSHSGYSLQPLPFNKPNYNYYHY